MSEKPNPKLEELKHKWDEDFFGLDSAGVYGVGEAIEEAIDEVTNHFERHFERRDDGLYHYRGETQGAVGVDSLNDAVSREFGRQRKMCHICHAPARNDPCDQCYKMVREAAEWTNEQCIMEVYPCVMCGTEVYSTICGPCMDVMLLGE